MNRGLPVFDLARGRDSWCSPKGARPLGTRMWLPVEERIVCKIFLLTFKCLNGLAPPYLCDLITKYVPRRNLRSINGHRLVDVGYKITRYGLRSFSVASAKLWNALPLDIHTSDNLMQFKRKLKTHLFRKAFY